MKTGSPEPERSSADYHALNGILLGDPIWNHLGSSCLKIDHGVAAIAVAAKFSGLSFENFKTHFYAVLDKIFHPRAHHEKLSQAERSFELDVRRPDVPTEPRFDEFLHRHLVAAGHLIVTRGQHVIHVTTGVDVLVHVDVVRTNLQFGFKFGFAEGHMKHEEQMLSF